MVCCDVCQRWVHSDCDGISDEKYLQFQADDNLQYKCATCRGECYQVNDLEDAVLELWKRRDIADRDLIASLRAAAGLPTQEEIFSLSPYSDDEENGPMMLKYEFGRSLKFSLKGLADKSPKKNNEYGKKSSSKKHPKKKAHQTSLISKGESQLSFEGNQDLHSQGYSLGEERNNEVESQTNEEQDISSPVAGICSTYQPGVLKHKLVDEVMVSDEDRTSRVIKIKRNKPHNLDCVDDNGKHNSKSKTVKAKKLVINLGAQKINVTNSPMSNASSFQRAQDVTSYNGDRVDRSTQSRGVKIMGREGNFIKFGKIRSEIPESRSKAGAANSSDGYGIVPLEHTHIASEKGNIDGNRLAAAPSGNVSTLRGGKVVSGKQLEDRDDIYGESSEDYGRTPILNSLPKDPKPSLKFKLKKPVLDNQYSQTHYDEEKSSSIKGQRSKRKRPSPFMEKSFLNEDEDVNVTQSRQDSLMDGMMDASWILKKLGKDAVGKKVEIHQASDNSWHKGAVTNSIEGTSTLSVKLDDGRVRTLELGKQGIRFVLQKQKREKKLKLEP
ncbi:hypothetical protein F3Y22_tig00111394pilonHSYRG00081 [Hibiscus syriacus]|uniref:Uncharacterized protein n=1 Tax=Hibiscus syriacus TaxID=106335 RepID=A0A6A2YL27_HIBSY|nr:hypothetical protein F3Y22_tig00111394pilonHSYRG00081 [Hibiscus syriacus]